MVKARLPDANKHQCIMVVDDDPEIRELISRTLELEGYDVATASDGNVVLSVMQEQSPDLLILDIVMPQLDGFQLLKLIRQHSNIPVFVLTARCETMILEESVALGADGYLRKPFRPRELAMLVRTNLRRGLVAEPVKM